VILCVALHVLVKQYYVSCTVLTFSTVSSKLH